jgi:hypothetical protein
MAELRTMKGSYSSQEVERLFWQWQADNNIQHLYSLHFPDDGMAACHFDQLKLNWFEVSPTELGDCLQGWSEQ